MIGAAVVLLSNMTVARISALYMTLLPFVGQGFTGLAVDIAVSRSLSRRNLIGGALVAVGIALNLCLDRRASA